MGYEEETEETQHNELQDTDNQTNRELDWQRYRDFY